MNLKDLTIYQLKLCVTLPQMGIKSGSSFYYSIKDIDLVTVAKCLRCSASGKCPNVYVDCNWIANYCGKCDGSYVKKTMEILKILAKAGFSVYPIFDGDKRHHSKVASITRSLRQEMNNIDVLKLRTLGMSISASLKSCSEDDKDKEKGKLRDIEKQLSSAENSISYPFPRNFFDLFVEEFKKKGYNNTEMSGGIVHAPIQCVFQADTLICKAVKSKICDLVFANDTDFGFLTGGKILQVSSFKVIGRNPLLKILHGITISSPCYELMKKFKKSVPEKKKTKYK